METKQHRLCWRRHFRKAKQIALREFSAFFILISVLAGTLAFFAVTKGSWDNLATSWYVLAIVATLLSLPKIYPKLAEYKGPYIIWFASAFREGFLFVMTLPTGPTKCHEKLVQFWTWLKHTK